MSRPSPYELWKQAGEDGVRYRALLREYGLLVDRKPGDDPNLPCGWPGRRVQDTTTVVAGGEDTAQQDGGVSR